MHPQEFIQAQCAECGAYHLSNNYNIHIDGQGRSPSCSHTWWFRDTHLMLQGALSILVPIHRLFLFNNNLLSWVVSFGDTWIGPIHVHLDTMLVWYTLRVLIFVGGKVSCAHVPFGVNSSFLTPLMFPSLVQKICAWHPSFSEPIVSSAWMTLL